ncbi:uncharacterized protein LOC129585811 [Paramacrobiotus metropolitanus]|uniref:uncharacterized protein LOC129585811 n=1 Tax=Paramacrobiotus metropolitanus TaxID=2943436 RepID=UPI0024458028|nr:uncharacterized protein LOC129585811 [Paramacrobiotus metropolitanus]
MASIRLILILSLLAIVGWSPVYAGGILDSIKDVLGFGTKTDQIVIPSTGASLPPFFRVEMEIVRLSNQAGIQASGSSCDKLDACDTWVYSYIDTEKPTASFPGSLAVSAIPKVFESVDNNSPNINALITRDICNPKDVANIRAVGRVHVMDHNKVLSDSLINDFDCSVGGAVANNQQSAAWTDSQCIAKHVPKKMQLFARTRIYRIPPGDCTNARLSATTEKPAKG